MLALRSEQGDLSKIVTSPQLKQTKKGSQEDVNSKIWLTKVLSPKQQILAEKCVKPSFKSFIKSFIKPDYRV